MEEEKQETPSKPEVAKESTIGDKVTKKEEVQERLFNIETAREFGNFYSNLIHGILRGELGIDVSGLHNPEDRLLAETMLNSVQSHLKTQGLKFELANMNAKDLLSQAFKTPTHQELLKDDSQYRLVEHAKGMYEIDINHEFFEKLYGRGSQAVAVKVYDGVSFIMVPRFEGTENQIDNNRIEKENLPHETHHIVWQFLKEDGLITNTEEDPEMSKAFTTYQDEIIARMVSSGSLSGYTHLQKNMGRAQNLESENPELFHKIQKNMISTNDMFKETNERINKSLVRKTDLILAAVQSSSFQDLKSQFTKVKEYVNEHTDNSEQNSGNGWTSV